MTKRITAWLVKVGHTNPNQSLLGVEFVSFGEPVTDAQIKSFWSWAKEVNAEYDIPLPTEFNTFYHQESSYWKEKVDYKRVLAGGDGVIKTEPEVVEPEVKVDGLSDKQREEVQSIIRSEIKKITINYG
jgi:hypothetical protein